MTNRIDYQDQTLTEPSTKEAEVIYLAEVLGKLGRPINVQQAKEVLAFALENAPGAWLISLADLETLWGVVIITEAVKMAA